LACKDAAHRVGVRGIGPEAVDGLRRKRDQQAVAQSARGERDGGGGRGGNAFVHGAVDYTLSRGT
jgi:hypothetical protein